MERLLKTNNMERKYKRSETAWVWRLIFMIAALLFLTILLGSCSPRIMNLDLNGTVVGVDGTRATILFNEVNGRSYSYDFFEIDPKDSIRAGDPAEIVIKKR